MAPGVIIFNKSYTIKDVVTYCGNGSVVIQDEITLKPFTFYVNYNGIVSNKPDNFFVFNTGGDKYVIPYKSIEKDIQKDFGIHRYKDIYEDGIRTIKDMCGIPRNEVIKNPVPETCKSKKFIDIGGRSLDDLEEWVIDFIEYYFSANGRRDIIRPIGFNNDSTLFFAEIRDNITINRFKMVKNNPYPLRELFEEAQSYFQNQTRWFSINGMTLINQLYYLPKIENYFFPEDEQLLSECFKNVKLHPFRKWLELYLRIDSGWGIKIGLEDAYYGMLDKLKKKEPDVKKKSRSTSKTPDERIVERVRETFAERYWEATPAPNVTWRTTATNANGTWTTTGHDTAGNETVEYVNPPTALRNDGPYRYLNITNRFTNRPDQNANIINTAPLTREDLRDIFEE